MKLQNQKTVVFKPGAKDLKRIIASMKAFDDIAKIAKSDACPDDRKIEHINHILDEYGAKWGKL